MTQSADQYFAIIPESVLHADISSHAVRVYGILRRHADKDDGTCHPGRARISRLGHMSVRTVDKAIDELVEIGALKVRHRHDPDHTDRMLSNEYTLLTPVHILHHPPANPAPPPCTDCTGTKAIEPESTNQKNIRSTYVDPMFDTFWQNYPRKVGRKKCCQWWNRNAPLIAQHILDSLDQWCLYWEHAVTDNRYIPHPYTWLNQERYDDPPPAVVNQRTDTVLAVLETINQQQPALEAHNDPF